MALVDERQEQRTDRRQTGAGGVCARGWVRQCGWYVCGALAVLAVSCGALYLPPVQYAEPLIMCHEWPARPDGFVCADGLLPTAEWPDEAVICIDTLRTCARLGELRSWILRHSQQLEAD